MRRVGFLAFFVILVIAGGGLTAQLLQDAPILIQSEIPDASVFEATPQQANQFIFWVVFVIINVVVVAAVLALLMWNGHRGVRVAENTEARSTRLEQEQLPEPSGKAIEIAR